ncbi:MAG TPA: DinB family protein [Pyrinomonadaceae bacterium]|jgi:hypothetical protein
MIYHSVAQIFEAIDETRERLYRTVEGLSETEAAHRASPEGWSTIEILEHLTIMEERLTRLMGVMLAKAEAAGLRSGEGYVQIRPFSLDKFIEQSAAEKYNAPEQVRPTGSATLPELLARIRRSREELKSQRARMEVIELSSMTYAHPAFGPLDFYQWLALIGMHEERHLRQIETVLSSRAAGAGGQA